MARLLPILFGQGLGFGPFPPRTFRKDGGCFAHGDLNSWAQAAIKTALVQTLF